MMGLGFPYGFDTRGRTDQSVGEREVRELLEQLLFTAPGERVNRPSFGTGLSQLLFSPNSDELATATQVLVQGALQQWLGHAITVLGVEVQSDEAQLRVTVRYQLRRDGARRSSTFIQELAT